MSVFSVGRLCVKLAGRDAGRKCVVVSSEKDGKVLIDGNTRRREVSVKHLEALPETLDVADGADHSAVSKVFEASGLKVWNTTPRKSSERTLKQKVVKGQGKKKAAKPAAKVPKAKAATKAKAPAKKEAKAEKKADAPKAEASADSLVEKAE